MSVVEPSIVAGAAFDSRLQLYGSLRRNRSSQIS